MITELENAKDSVPKFDPRIFFVAKTNEEIKITSHNGYFFWKTTHITETLYFLILIFTLSQVSVYI